MYHSKLNDKKPFCDYLFVLNEYWLCGGEHVTVCMGREHGEPL